MQKYITKMLDWGVKVCSLAITGPATWITASYLFSDVQSQFLLFLIRGACVFVVEGVMLSNWIQLETDKNATPEIKARYGLTALAMYVGMLVIGWAHEGPVGLVFRFALLAALLGSGWDTYVYTWHKATANVDRNVLNSWTVRSHARKLSVIEAKARRTADHEVIMANTQYYQEGELIRGSLSSERNIVEIQTEHTQMLEQMQVPQLPAGDNRQAEIDRLQAELNRQQAETDRLQTEVEQAHRQTEQQIEQKQHAEQELARIQAEQEAAQRKAEQDAAIEAAVSAALSKAEQTAQKHSTARQSRRKTGTDTYRQTDTGEWEWCCTVCDVCSAASINRTYSTETAAHKGYAGHAGSPLHKGNVLKQKEQQQTEQTDTQADQIVAGDALVVTENTDSTEHTEADNHPSDGF